MHNKINVALIGFGLSGRVFHAPLLNHTHHFQIRKIFSSRDSIVRESLPDVDVVSHPEQIITDSNIDLVINCAPNEFHYSFTKSALENNKHVVVEKPFAITTNECKELELIAKKYNKVLTVFHNRRWDSDFLTVQKIIASQKLGTITLFESHFDRFRPNSRKDRWKERPGVGSGVLYDLGSHLIDQALTLFGLPDQIFADLATQKDIQDVVDYFHLILYYGKSRVILHSDSFGDVAPRFRIMGAKGSFVKFGLDPQENQLSNKMSPLDDSFGIDNPADFGSLYCYENASKTTEAFPSCKGNYLEFYRLLYRAIAHGEPAPVAASEAQTVIRIIELAHKSSNEKKVLDFTLG